MFFIFRINIALIVSLLFSFSAAAQRIDNTASFKTIPGKEYLRFQYDNDFFTKTDFYYTQGVQLEYGSPALKDFLLSRLLLKTKGAGTKYSVGLNLAAFSPTNISSNNILSTDRPFAGVFYFSTNATVTMPEREQRLSSSLTIGVIGPAAQGKEIQTGIHKWLKNITPQGWQYQVQNDIILNYDVKYEKKLASSGDHILVNATALVSIGTLTDKLSGGFNLMAGNYNDPSQTGLTSGKKIQYYLYGQARTSLVGYDATMQGGLFNKKSPYTIASGNINRVTLQADAGIVVDYKDISLCYSQSFLTKEFKTGRHHRWGGVSVCLAF